MATEAEILTKLNDLLDGIDSALDASGASKLLTLDRTTGADAALVYLRENGDEKFRWGMPGGEDDFVIQYSPDGSPLTYADVFRIDAATGAITITGLAIDAPSFNNASFTGQSLFAAGSAAAPSIANEGNTNTGLFFPAADQIAAVTGGAEVARFTPTGLAIGKSAASYLLDIAGAARLEVMNIVGTAPVINFTDTDDGVTGQIGSGTSDFNIASNVSIDIRPNNVRAGFISNSGWQFFANETEVARFAPAGLGFGTSSVGAAIDIAKGTGSTIRFRDAAGTHGYQIRSNVNGTNNYGLLIEDLAGTDLYWVQGGASGFHRWFIDGAEAMCVDSAGRVGVKTSSPDYILDVNGTFGVAGTATFGGNIVLSSDDFRFYPTTADNADTARVALLGGGGLTTSRGAYIYACGNEHATTPGKVVIAAGASAVAEISATTISLIAIGSTLFSSGGLERARVNPAGQFLIGTTSGASKLVVADDSIQINTPKTPASATDTGATGQIAWDGSFLYVCTAPDTWVRAALSTW